MRFPTTAYMDSRGGRDHISCRHFFLHCVFQVLMPPVNLKKFLASKEPSEQVLLGGRLRVFTGTIQHWLPKLDRRFFDAALCDPPYDLGGSGFMGHEWDKRGVAFDSKTWHMVQWLLKPGGHLIAFGGTRTFHRMMVAAEDAGFDVVDTLLWMYGCLSDDSDILTDRGWVNGLDVKVGDRVAAWDSSTGEIIFQAATHVTKEWYDGDLIRLHNDDTSQLLTPNHRVYKKHAHREQVAGVRRRFFEDEWSVIPAVELNRWQAMKLPLAGFHEGPGIGGEDYASFLGWVWTEGGFDQEWNGVRITQSSVNAENVKSIRSLFEKLHIEHSEYHRDRVYKGRMYTEYTWYFSGDEAKRVRELLPGKHPTYDLLWGMSQIEKVAFLDAATAGDGSGCQFYQKDDADREWFLTALHMTGQCGRDNPSKYCVTLRHSDTTELARRHLSRVPTQHYSGYVWCVCVPAMAFVARRRGKVFITGNSGFPKGQNISLGLKQSTAAGTAERWEGYGTTLKPAFEPCPIFRKPMSGTYVENVLLYDTGGLNIAGCRIGTDKVTVRGGGANHYAGVKSFLPYQAVNVDRSGRYPSNIVMSHHALCRKDKCVKQCPVRMLDKQAGKLTSGQPGIRRKPSKSVACGSVDTRGVPEIGYADTGQASRFFYVAKVSRAERDAGTTGGNNHPCIKPIDLCRYFATLILPPARKTPRRILVPFAGSGSEVIGALLAGWDEVYAIEQDSGYVRTMVQRTKHWCERSDSDAASSGGKEGGAAPDLKP